MYVCCILYIISNTITSRNKKITFLEFHFGKVFFHGLVYIFLHKIINVRKGEFLILESTFNIPGVCLIIIEFFIFYKIGIIHTRSA